MIKFVKPTGYEAGTLNWQVRVTGGADVSSWYWNTEAEDPDLHNWDYMNGNDGGSNPPTQEYRIPASYFNNNGVLWLLFEGDGYPDGIDGDVVDIQW